MSEETTSPKVQEATKAEDSRAGGSQRDGGSGGGSGNGTGDGGEAFKIFIKYGDKTKRARVEVLP